MRSSFAILFLMGLALAATAQTMVTYYSYTFNYTYPEPAVQSITAEVGRPVRVDVQVVDGANQPFDIDGATLQSQILQPEDSRRNQIASVTAVNKTNGQYYISVTPTLSGTAQIKVDAYDSSTVLIAMVGQFNLTVTNPAPSISSALNITTPVTTQQIAVVTVTNSVFLETAPSTVSLANASSGTNAIISVKFASGSGSVVINAQSGDRVEGETSITLTRLYEAVDLISDGVTNWFIF